MQLTTAHSLWLAPLCLLLGAAYAWGLYRNSAARNGWTPVLWRVMAALRALTVALLAFFLLEPMVRVMMREVRKPVLVLAHDGSSSLKAAGDTSILMGAYRADLQELIDRLSEDHDVRTFTYAAELQEGLSFDQQGERTDIDRVFRAVHDRFAGPDLGAVIIDGDGIYNRGRDPLLAAERLGVPVTTIALGDTTVRPDLVLRDVEFNRVSYFGNAFPVRVRVQAHHLKGKGTRVVIMHEGREVVGQELAVDADPFSTELSFLVKATAAGGQRYSVVLKEIDGEAALDNNRRSFLIEVLDDRKQVLILADAPHPDVAAIRAALEAVEGYEVSVAYGADPGRSAEELDLVVLHQAPTNSTKATLAPFLQRLELGAVPVWMILGGRSALEAAEPLGVQVRSPQPTYTDAQVAMGQTQSFFTLDPEDIRAYERFPPLQVPFGQYALGRGATALMTQRIGVVATEYPLITVQGKGERRSAVVCGEGLWRWRLSETRSAAAPVHFDRLMQRIAQFLSTDRTKDRFKVGEVPEFAHGDPIVLTAELYNASYEPVNGPEVSMRLRDEAGQEFVHVFSPVGNAYRLDAGTLPPGRYTWVASTTLDGQRFTDEGLLEVNPTVVERLSTVADHGLWSRIAARTGGHAVGMGGVATLADLLQGDGKLAARSYAHAAYHDLVGLRWIFFLLLGLLTIEWVLRRRNGAY